MATNTVPVTGQMVAPDQNDISSGMLTFTLASFDTDTTEGELIFDQSVTVQVAGNGTFTVDLWPTDQGDFNTYYKVTYTGVTSSGSFTRALGNIFPDDLPGLQNHKLEELLRDGLPGSPGVNQSAAASAADAAQSAKEAETAKGKAEDAERGAVVAQTTATAAADSAQGSAAQVMLAALAVGSQVYADTTEGLAAVAEGEFFYTPQDGGLFLYREVGGVAVLQSVVVRPAFLTREGAVAMWDAFVLAGVTPPIGTVWDAEGISFQYDGITGASTDITDMPGWKPFGRPTPLHWGRATGVDGWETYISMCWQYCGEFKKVGFVEGGSYRINDQITAYSAKMEFAEGVEIDQHGQVGLYLPGDTTNISWEGRPTFNLNATTVTGRTLFCRCEGIRECRLGPIKGVGYNDATVMLAKMAGTEARASANVTLGDWEFEDCANGIIFWGYQPESAEFDCDGVETQFQTSMNVAHESAAQVKVLLFDADLVPTPLSLNADYTVTYVGGFPRIQTVATYPTGSSLLVLTGQPLGANRVPISNWHISRFWTDNVKFRCILGVQWTDAMSFTSCRFKLGQDNGVAVELCPFEDRGTEVDYFEFRDCGFTYSNSANVTTLTGLKCGPGTKSITGSVRLDNTWEDTSLIPPDNKFLKFFDTFEVDAGLGTLTATNGSRTITFAGTVVFGNICITGNQGDRLKIDGRVYGITSIDSPTQVTLSSNFLGTTGSGKSVSLINLQNKPSYDLQFNNIGGAAVSLMNNNQIGRMVYGSRTEFYTTATVPNGASSVDIEHECWRSPALHEIQLTPGHPQTSGAYAEVLTAPDYAESLPGTLRIHLPNGPTGATRPIGVRVLLRNLNA